MLGGVLMIEFIYRLDKYLVKEEDLNVVFICGFI